MRPMINPKSRTRRLPNVAALLCACILAVAPLRADGPRQDTAQSPGENAALADYLKEAARNNPGLRAASMRWRAALARVAQAKSLPDPRFTYRYFIQEVETRVGPQRHSFSLSQKFPFYGKRALRADAALDTAEAARQAYQAAKLDLAFRVRDAFYEYYYVTRAARVTEQSLHLLERLESVAQAKFRAGKGSSQNVLKLQVELGKLANELAALRDLRAPVVARLNAALGRDPAAELPPPTDPPAAFAQVDEADVLRAFADLNPQIRRLDHEMRTSRKRVDLARRDYFPDVTLGVTFIETGRPLNRNVRDSGKDPVIGMLSINLPIMYGRLSAAKAEARAVLRGDQGRRTDAENVLRARLKLALYKLRDAQRQIRLYRDALIPKAQQTMAVAETGYVANTVDFQNLIDSERMLLQFKLAYCRARAVYEQCLAEVETLAGKRMPRERKE